MKQACKPRSYASSKLRPHDQVRSVEAMSLAGSEQFTKRMIALAKSIWRQEHQSEVVWHLISTVEFCLLKIQHLDSQLTIVVDTKNPQSIEDISGLVL